MLSGGLIGTLLVLLGGPALLASHPLGIPGALLISAGLLVCWRVLHRPSRPARARQPGGCLEGWGVRLVCAAPIGVGLVLLYDEHMLARITQGVLIMGAATLLPLVLDGAGERSDDRPLMAARLRPVRLNHGSHKDGER